MHQPIIYDTQDCLATCRKDVSTSIFDQIYDVSSWIQPHTGKVIKRELVKRDILFKAHLRAQIHDRSAPEIKKILINGDDLAPFGLEEDLATTLGKVSRILSVRTNFEHKYLSENFEFDICQEKNLWPSILFIIWT